MPSAIERQILTHYWVSPEPFPRKSDLVAEIIANYVSLGLLKTEGDDVVGVSEALRPYMEALESVPLPEQRWVIPNDD